MPRSRAASPLRKYHTQIQKARQRLESVADSAHPFATAAREGWLRPDSPFDAFTIAFAAALDETLNAHHAQRNNQQPHGRQSERFVTSRLGERLGLSPTSTRATRDGERWVQLPEVLAGLKIVDGFGGTFSRHLDVLLRDWPYLLHKDPPGHPTLSFARATSDPSAGSGAVVVERQPRRLKEKDVLHLERQVREAVSTLAAAQERAALRGRPLPSTVDWDAVASVLDPTSGPYPVEDEALSLGPDQARPRQDGRWRGVKPLSDLGIDNLNDDVRAVFGDGQSHTARAVISSIQQVARERQIARGLKIEPVPDDAIRAALWRLHSRPSDATQRWLVHADRTYRPGPRWFRERGTQGDR